MKPLHHESLTSGKTLIRLLSAANFLAALGGGTVLRQRGESLQVGRSDETLVVALLLGTSMGLGILAIIPHRWSRRITSVLSFGAAISSLLVLLLILVHGSEEPIDQSDFHAWIIFALLCFRFSLFFVARSLRTEMASSQGQNLGWVDLGYYSGMVLGLVAWGTSTGSAGVLDLIIKQIGLTSVPGQTTVLLRVLVADCLLQLAAGVLDILWSRTKLGTDKVDGPRPIPLSSIDRQWYSRLTVAVVFLTAGTQIIIFLFRGLLNNVAPAASSSLGPNVLATFYVAVSLGAFVFGSLKWHFTWHDDPGKPGLFGSLQGPRKRVSVGIFSSVIAALIIVCIVFNLVRIDNSLSLSYVTGAGLLVLLGIAAFLYEILTSTILVRISKKGKELHRKNMVAVSFGFMGVGAVIVLVLLERWVHVATDQKSGVFLVGSSSELHLAHYMLLLGVVTCFGLTNLALAWPAKNR